MSIVVLLLLLLLLCAATAHGVGRQSYSNHITVKQCGNILCVCVSVVRRCCFTTILKPDLNLDIPFNNISRLEVISVLPKTPHPCLTCSFIIITSTATQAAGFSLFVVVSTTREKLTICPTPFYDFSF